MERKKALSDLWWTAKFSFQIVLDSLTFTGTADLSRAFALQFGHSFEWLSRNKKNNFHEWPRKNFSLKYQHNINHISDENKEKYQFGDN